MKNSKPVNLFNMSLIALGMAAVVSGCQVHHCGNCADKRVEGCYEAGPRGPHTCDSHSNCHPGRACSIHGWCHDEKDLTPDIRMPGK